MRNVPIDSEALRFAGALDLEATATGFVPRRLPAWTKPQLSDVALEAVVQMPAGVRLEFTSTTTTLELDVQLTLIRQLPRELKLAPFELVVDGDVVALMETPVGHVINLGPASDELSFDPGQPATVTFAGLAPQSKRIELWLPQASAVELRALRVDDGASVEATAVGTARRWVHYGSSISHGAGALTPTWTWPAMVARTVGLDHTNLGFAGQCMLDPFVARTIRDLDADIISMKVGCQHHRRGRHARAPVRPGAARVPRHHPRGEAGHADPRRLTDLLTFRREPSRPPPPQRPGAHRERRCSR